MSNRSTAGQRRAPRLKGLHGTGPARQRQQRAWRQARPPRRTTGTKGNGSAVLKLWHHEAFSDALVPIRDESVYFFREKVDKKLYAKLRSASGDFTRRMEAPSPQADLPSASLFPFCASRKERPPLPRRVGSSQKELQRKDFDTHE